MKKYSLADVTLDRLAILFYGEYGAGKTFMIRDILQHELDNGADPESLLYVSLAGDEGYMPLKGLNVQAVELDDPEDIPKLITHFSKNPLHLLAVDGLDKLSDLSMVGTIKGDRVPRTGSASDNEWGSVHRDFFRSLGRLRKCADFFIATSPADNYTDPVTGDKRVYPDLPGSQASRIIGSFDFAVGLEVRINPRGIAQRMLRVKPTGSGGNGVVAFKLRQRLVRELTEDIPVPVGGGAWAVLKRQIQEAMQS